MEQRLAHEQAKGMPTRQLAVKIARQTALVDQTRAALETEAVDLLQDIPDPPPHGLVTFDLPPDVPLIPPDLFSGGGGLNFQPPGTTEGSGGPGGTTGDHVQLVGGVQVLVIDW
jgi:hypothetical protein